MSELRRIGSFKDSGLSRGRVVLSDTEGDIRLEYRDGELYIHDKEPVGDYVAREVLPRVAGLQARVRALQDFLEEDRNRLDSVASDHERDVRELREALSRLGGGEGGLKELEESMPLIRIVDGRFSRYKGKSKGYVLDGYVTTGFEGVTYDMTLGDVLRSSLLCLNVIEEVVDGGMTRLRAELVSRDSAERRYLALSSYKPALRWERISPGGKDRSGELDSEWARSWRGKLYAEYMPTLLYDGTEFGCGMRKYDALLVYVSAKLRGGIEI